MNIAAKIMTTMIATVAISMYSSRLAVVVFVLVFVLPSLFPFDSAAPAAMPVTACDLK